MPAAQLTDEEQAFLDGPDRRTVRMLDDWESPTNSRPAGPRSGHLSRNIAFFAMIIPKQYGGLEFSPFAVATVLCQAGEPLHGRRIDDRRAEFSWARRVAAALRHGRTEGTLPAGTGERR